MLDCICYYNQRNMKFGINSIKKHIVMFGNILKAFLPFIGIFVVIVAFHFTDWIFFKFYPPVVNFGLFVIFFFSTFREKTVIQKIALSIEPEAKPPVLDYTKKLTYVWSGFMLINFLVSVATIFMSKEIWAIYNGLVSYILVGIMFGVEYIVRINFKRKYDC